MGIEFSSGSARQGFAPGNHTGDPDQGSGSSVSNNPITVESAPLMFPQDMQSGSFYPECIKFSIYTRQGVSYKNLKQTFRDYKINGEAREQSTQKSIEEDNANGAYETVKKLIPSMDQIKGTANKVRTVLTSEKSTEKFHQSISLNMPASVTFTEGVEWQGSDLGVIGALKQGGVKTAIENGLLSSSGVALGGAVGAVAGIVPGLSSMAGGIIGSIAAGAGVQSAIESTFNVKANPYKEQTFQGVGFRPFDFSFTLRARSQSDVNVIKKIITAFRAHSKPSFDNTSKGGVFNYPKEFRIEYLTLVNDEYINNPYIPEIKYCVCTGVTTNFAGNGWRSFKGGAPVDITLGLTFQETEIITQEDVMGNTEIGRFAGKEKKF